MTSETVHDTYVLPTEIEEQRVRSLEQLQVIDTPEEERFARITRMARLVFGVPMSAINFMHRDRQWCKQFDGVGEIEINVQRELAVCRATIARAYQRPREPELILEDASLSEFAQLPAIKAEGGIRFYAGHPLYGPGGHPVGTFCIYDTRPRSLDARQRETFRGLAAWAQRELERSDDLDRAATSPRSTSSIPPASAR